MSAVDFARRPSWTFYALGGGLGHVNRALALARYAASRQIPSRILCNSPFLPNLLAQRAAWFIELDSNIEFVRLSSSLSKEETITAIRAEIEPLQADDVLIVDTFPRGLGGELACLLPSNRSFKVLIHRDVNPDYVHKVQLESCFAQYNLVLAPGEDGPLAQLAHARTAPWLICNWDELLDRSDARVRLNVDKNSRLPLIVVTGSGSPNEAQDAAELARQLHDIVAEKMVVRFASLDDQALRISGEVGVVVWPLLALHAGIDLLIGGGGYHTVYEARATGRSLIGTPYRRMYDRQSRRLSDEEAVENVADLVTRLSKFYDRFDAESVDTPVQYSNGAAQACELIERSWRDWLSLGGLPRPASS